MRPFARRSRLAAALVTVLALFVAACSDGGSEGRARPRPSRPTPPASAPPPSAPASAVQPAHRTYTITGNRAGFAHGWELLRNETPAEVDADLDAMAATGARWLRALVEWSHVEKTAGTYDWSNTDRVIDGARARGFDVVALVTYAPPWAAAPGCRSDTCAPRDPAAYARFLGDVVRRYQPLGVTHWEIWNEPNHVPFWQPRPDPRAYATLLEGAYLTVKGIDPQATVITGGLSPARDAGGEIAPLTFLRAIYDAGAGGFFDAVAHHPYQFPNHPTSGESTNAFMQTLRIHDLMVEHGDGSKQVWGTEVGAPTRGGSSVSEAEQAAWLREYYDTWNSWSFTGPLLWYTARDRGNGADWEDSYGMFRHDRSPKPAVAAFDTMIRDSDPLPSHLGPLR